MTPTVRVDDEVYEQLKAHAEPFVDTPNTVLRRLLGLTSTDEYQDDDRSDVDGLNRGQEGAPTLSSVSDVPERSPRKSKTGRSNRKTSSKRTRVPSGTLLAEDHYELPLLESLAELGGSAPSRDIIEMVGKKLADRLTDVDKATLKSGGIRWQSRVQFVRLRMIEQGFMIKESGRGVWAISDSGRDRISANTTGVA